MSGTGSDAGKVLTYQFNDGVNVVCVQEELGYAQSNTFSSTVANQQESASKLQKAVMNLLKNMDFASGWTASNGSIGTTARDTGTRCLGLPTLKITKTGTAEAKYSQQIAVSKAGDYTFSV